jgi:hypothetical protein
MVMSICSLVACNEIDSATESFSHTLWNSERNIAIAKKLQLHRETMSSHQVDQEASGAKKEFLDGYVDFAEFIASDGQLSIFKQFRTLAARNLLYLEAEPQLLQFEIQAIDDADQALLNDVDEERKTKTEEAIRAWECFKQQTGADPRQAKKLEMIMKPRSLMTEYGMLI